MGSWNSRVSLKKRVAKKEEDADQPVLTEDEAGQGNVGMNILLVKQPLATPSQQRGDIQRRRKTELRRESRGMIASKILNV